MPTYEEYEKAATPSGLILCRHSWDKMTDTGRQRLFDLVAGKVKPLLTYEELAAKLAAAETTLHPAGPWTEGLEANRQQLQQDYFAMKQRAEAEVQTLIRGRASLVLDMYESELEVPCEHCAATTARATKAETRAAELQQEPADQEVQTLQWAKALAEHKNEISRLRADYDRSGQSGVCIQQLMLNGAITTEQCHEMMQALSSQEWHEYHRLALAPPPSSPAAAHCCHGHGLESHRTRCQSTTCEHKQAATTTGEGKEVSRG